MLCSIYSSLNHSLSLFLSHWTQLTSHTQHRQKCCAINKNQIQYNFATINSTQKFIRIVSISSQIDLHLSLVRAIYFGYRKVSSDVLA